MNMKETYVIIWEHHIHPPLNINKFKVLRFIFYLDEIPMIHVNYKILKIQYSCWVFRCYLMGK
jgi:hypothetical protein